MECPRFSLNIKIVSIVGCTFIKSVTIDISDQEDVYYRLNHCPYDMTSVYFQPHFETLRKMITFN